MSAGQSCKASVAPSRFKVPSWASLLTIAVLIALQGRVECECPKEDPALGEMVYYSDAVFLGTVLRHIDDPLKPGSFVAEMKVRCIYKGAPVPAIVNISDAGISPGSCLSTNYTVDASVIAYVEHTDKGGYRSKYRENPGSYADEILVLCDITAELPQGVDPEDMPKEDCELLEQDENEETCLPVQPTTKAPSTGNTPAPPEVYPESEADEKSEQDVPYDRLDTGAVEDEDDDDDSGSAAVHMRYVTLLISFLCAVILLS